MMHACFYLVLLSLPPCTFNCSNGEACMLLLSAIIDFMWMVLSGKNIIDNIWIDYIAMFMCWVFIGDLKIYLLYIWFLCCCHILVCRIVPVTLYAIHDPVGKCTCCAFLCRDLMVYSSTNLFQWMSHQKTRVCYHLEPTLQECFFLLTPALLAVYL